MRLWHLTCNYLYYSWCVCGSPWYFYSEQKWNFVLLTCRLIEVRYAWWDAFGDHRGDSCGGGSGLLAQFSRDYATTTGRTRSCFSARLPKWAQNWANFTATTRPDRSSPEVERRVEGVQSVHTEVETLLHIRSWVAREGDGRSVWPPPFFSRDL